MSETLHSYNFASQKEIDDSGQRIYGLRRIYHWVHNVTCKHCEMARLFELALLGSSRCSKCTISEISIMGDISESLNAHEVLVLIT